MRSGSRNCAGPASYRRWGGSSTSAVSEKSGNDVNEQSASRGGQQAAMALDRAPGLENIQNVPKLRRLIADCGLAEFLLQLLRDRLREPGAAADIDRVAVRVTEKGAPAELVGELHVVARIDLLEVCRRHFPGGAAT